VTFNMFTGQLPFPAVTSREALIMRLTEKPRTLAEITPDVQWPEEMQWVMDRALANHPGERYQHVNQFGRDLVKAVASMPQSALSQQGTIAITASHATDSALSPMRTEARKFGGETAAPSSGGARRATATVGSGGSSGTTGELAESAGLKKSHTGLWVGLFVLLAGGGGGGYWWYTQQQPPKPAAAATVVAPDSAAKPDSEAKLAALLRDSLARADSMLKADSAAKAKGPQIAPVPVTTDLTEVIQPIRDAIAAGTSRKNNGEYEMALVDYGNASDKLTELTRKYPAAPVLKQLKKEIASATAANANACKAERDDALSRGASPPDCP
jgi:hypothetical protein